MKKLNIFLIGIISLFAGFSKVDASGNIKVNASSIYLGNSVTVTVTVSNAAAWTVRVGVSGAASSSDCGTLNFADSSSDAQNTTKVYTATCKPKRTGTVYFTLSGDTTDAGGATTNLSGNVSVTVKNKPTNVTPPSNNKPSNNKPGTVTPKSSVNYLKSLEVEGHQISPKFDKETNEYTIELASGTDLINIKASSEHSKATITGTGEKRLTEGVNNIDIIVTAENGSKRTYKIKAIVKEKDPIIVDIDGLKYTIIRKKEQLIDSSAFYSETSVKINNEQIPAYYGEVTGYTLVGLKNSDGIINLFIYDEKNNTYKLYRELNFSKVVFYPIDIDKNIPNKYKKYTTIINDTELTCYKINENDDFMLLYGLNVENNHEGFYIYDQVENTLQRYNGKIFDDINEEIFVLKRIIAGLFLIAIIVIITSAVQGTSNKNKRKKEPGLIYKPKTKEEKRLEVENKKEAKLLEKELKRKEKDSKKSKPKKRKKVI